MVVTFIPGSTFSGIVTEPASITDGPVNLKFTSNCITLLCPIKETSIKTWLLHKITSFGQCGGILTFEICTNCTDSPGSISRCSINLIQEKPTIILNILERAIRSNPNTNEIHYERSILGDIYHCGHDCTQPGRLMPSYSDPNIFSSGGSFSPPRTPIAASFEVHPVEQVDSGDSGLPGTPQPEELSSTGIPSPTSSYKSNVFRSPRHQPHHRVSPNEEEHENPPAFRRRRSDESVSSQRRSDEIRTSTSSPYTTVRPIANPSINHTSPNHGRVQYAVINHSASRVKLVRPPEYEQERQQTTGSIPYTPVTANTTEQVPRDRKSNYNKLKTLEESTEVTDDVIYDVPNCEPYPDTFSPSSAPARSHMDTFASKSLGYHPPSLSPNYNSHPKSPARSPVQSSMYTPGTDLQDREEDYEDSWIPPIPNHKYRGQPPPVKTKPINVHSDSRRRFQSSSDVLDTPMASSYDPQRLRRSTDDNALTYRTRAQSITHNNRQLEKTSKDFLQRLNEEEEKLTKVLAASRKEKNEELGEEARDRLGDLNRPYMFNMDDLDHDYSDPDMILETCSNLVDYQTRSQPSYLPNRMLTKEPTNNIKGYAYKVQIPFTNTQYDVPRRAAAAPDLRTMSEDAPPKPKRHISTEHLYYVH